MGQDWNVVHRSATESINQSNQSTIL